MKKIVIFTMVLVFFSVCSVGFAATKYDIIVKSSEYKKISEVWATLGSKSPILKRYMEQVITMDDLNQALQNGAFDPEKERFVRENKNSYLTYLRMLIFNQIIKTVPKQTKDSEWIYITGVIKKHREGGSITGKSKSRIRPEEAAMEEALFEGHFLYYAWKQYHGRFDQIANEQVDQMYMYVTKRK